MLKEILADIIKVDDVLMVVKSNGATIEMRSNSLSIRQKEKWITIGENDGPCHMHVNNEMIKNAEFVIEQNLKELVSVLDFLMKKMSVFLDVFLQKCTMKTK